ncbi:MAG: 4-hydroxy-tetrahydrodipicolinate synthase [Planctomycetota bacterium]|nr:4-hydroxy-tetrahydrodipicolinate synthase [Planctomycetota bacterium]MDI6788168.1 4-hydroxy-tetrahydrodipicolinate synthase [Planctomycetota bacterium]
MVLANCITAMVTPFKNNKVDYKKLLELIDFQIENSVSGLVLCGTTGEGSTLTDEEKEKIFKVSVRHVRGRITLIGGTGTNDTAKTIKLSRMAQDCGMDAVLVVTPYYNKPTQQGLFLHFSAVARSVRIPIILYNVPGRTGVSITPETVARLSALKNIVAIKEASGDLDAISRLKKLCDITILSGEDSLTFPILCLGGRGVISVASNIVPRDMVKMIDEFNNGNLTAARQYHLKLHPLMKALFIESNPIPVKTAMKILGMLNGEIRLPLCQMSKENTAKLKVVIPRYS